MPQQDLAVRRAAIGRASRAAKRTGDVAAVDVLRSEYAIAKIEDYVRRTVDQAPPLTADQRARLAALLAGGHSD